VHLLLAAMVLLVLVALVVLVLGISLLRHPPLPMAAAAVVALVLHLGLGVLAVVLPGSPLGCLLRGPMALGADLVVVPLALEKVVTALSSFATLERP
jgi:hypothetical protein